MSYFLVLIFFTIYLSLLQEATDDDKLVVYEDSEILIFENVHVAQSLDEQISLRIRYVAFE